MEVSGHRSAMCIARSITTVQQLDSLCVRPVGALASREDLQRCSTSWEDNFGVGSTAGKGNTA